MDIENRVAELEAEVVRVKRILDWKAQFEFGGIDKIGLVFSVSRVAEILGEEEELLNNVCATMEPQNGRITVVDKGKNLITALTADGIEYVKEALTRNGG